MSDPYVTLNVSRTSTKDEIKKAYRKLAMKFHPDRNPDDASAEEKFKKIKKAYDDLSKPKQQNSWHTYRQQSVRYSTTIQLSFKDAILGSEKLIHIDGEAYKIDVPFGIVSGQVIRYPAIANGADVIITYLVEQKKNWSIDGLNIIQKMDVSIWDLVVGCNLPISTIDGTKLAIRIPANTQPNTFLRVSNMGIQNKHQIGQFGDMLVQLNAIIPANVPNEIISAIKSFK